MNHLHGVGIEIPEKGSIWKSPQGALYEIVGIADRQSQIYQPRVIFRTKNGQLRSCPLAKWNYTKAADFDVDNTISTNIDVIDNAAIILTCKKLKTVVSGNLETAINIARIIGAKTVKAQAGNSVQIICAGTKDVVATWTKS